MSKIPVDKNTKLRSLELRGIYSGSIAKLKNLETACSSETSRLTDAREKLQAETKTKNDVKESIFSKTYASLIPKMSLEKVVEKNPKIHDLREKLNEITRKQDRNVDKKTKALINDITQLVDKTDEDESGPYSLLMDLQPNTSSSKQNVDSGVWCNQIMDGSRCDFNTESSKKSYFINKSAERLPNVINFDDKPMKEFEYSCENESSFSVKKPFNTHSRSDLCLQLKSHMYNRTFESNLSPNDNSMSRPNEENSLDDSLGILTPDQMDDICYLENAFSPTVEGLPSFCDTNDCKVSPDNGDTPSTDKTESSSAASTIQNDGFECINTKPCSFEKPLAPIVSMEAIMRSEDLSLPLTNIAAPENNHDPIHAPDSQSNSSVQVSKEFTNKEENMSNVMDEEFMPSIHSSILEPVSSIAENVNLDIPLDCKNIVITNRIEQTPSPEDLPLDHSDINGEISTYSQFSASTLHDSQTYSDSKNEYTKSMETSKVSNSFITSITSITSLDGYQGDGEMSRPVSRGADHSMEIREDAIEMDWQNVPVTRRADPMTDSDFFTESDADGLDDHMQRGDRKAQVIDGALYGGKNGNANLPLIVNRNEDSCMESSGVYTDFENHRSSPVFLNVIDDMSPEGSTPSTRSECSQKNSTGNINAYFSPMQEDIEEKAPKSTVYIDEEETPKNTSKRNSLNSEKDERSMEKKEEKRFTLKKYKMPKRDVPSKLKSMLANRKTEVDSVQSSPKATKKNDRRENLSKKNTIELKTDYKIKSFKDIKSKVDSFSLQRSQTSCSVSRMLSSKSPANNIKPKSRHMRMRMELGSANGSGKSSLHSSQSDISTISTPLGKHSSGRFPLLRNGKKRESAPPAVTPARPPATPPQPTPPPPSQVKKNGVVQKLSSSPVSMRARTSLAPPPSPRKPPPHRVPARPTTLPTNKEPPRVSAAVGARGKRAHTPVQGARTPAGPLPAPPPAPLAAPPLPVTPPKEQVASLAHAAKGVEALGVLVQYLVFRLDALNGGSWRQEAERWRSVAAAERSGAARADRDRQQRAQKDLDTIAECLSKISELEMEVASKEEANARLQAARTEEVAALASDIRGLKDTIESLKVEVAESRARLHAHSELERTLRAQLQAARAERGRARDAAGPGERPRDEPARRASQDCATDTACDRATDTASDRAADTCDAACDPVCCEAEACQLRLLADDDLSTDANELAAEVRSLRAVIELKQSEMCALREACGALGAERARRAAAEREARAALHAAEELRERAAARQRDADRLRDDNRRLRELAARDRDQAARLHALNEELRYKLHRKTHVVSLLGNGFMERGAMRTRTYSGESARSPSPPPDSPPSPAASPSPDSPPLPAVKGVVEKPDSVSWVLEIEESPEEVASRLARKSSFRAAGVAGAGAAGGVKRRGGGSPGGSPAPASPAPNASKLFRAGELEFPPPPPPLKESAGEAIYIYDDRHY